MDDALISGTFIANIDSLKNHFDERGDLLQRDRHVPRGPGLTATSLRTLLACAQADPGRPTATPRCPVADKTIDAYTDATVGASVASFIFRLRQAVR